MDKFGQKPGLSNSWEAEREAMFPDDKTRKQQEKSAYEARLRQAREDFHSNRPPPPGLDPVHPNPSDLAEVQAWESGHGRKRGTYFKRPRPVSLPVKLTTSARDLLEKIADYNIRGRICLGIGMLSNLIGKCEDTVRRASNDLARAGLIEKELQPTRGRKSRPNLYRVTAYGWTYLNRRPQGAAAGLLIGVRPEKIRHPYQDTSLLCKTDRNEAHASSAGALQAPNGAARHTEQDPAPAAPRQHGSEQQVRKATGSPVEGGVHHTQNDPPPAAKPPLDRAAALAATQAARKLCGTRSEMPDVVDPYDVIDIYRRQHLSRFDGGAWNRAIQAHGRETALLAAALAMLRKRDGRGAEIKSPASYLGAILRKSPNTTDLSRSLGQVLGG